MRRIAVNRPLLVSAVSIALALVVGLWQLPALVVAAFPPNLDKDPTSRRIAEYLDTHEQDMATYRARFDGRSALFRPKPPPPPPRTEVVVAPVPEEPAPPPPPTPSIYTGPSVAFVIGEEVYFSGGLRLRVGEEAQGVTVVETDPPWTVTLQQHGADHTIEIFDRGPKSFGSSARDKRLPPGMTAVKPTELARKAEDDIAADETSN